MDTATTCVALLPDRLPQPAAARSPARPAAAAAAPGAEPRRAGPPQHPQPAPTATSPPITTSARRCSGPSSTRGWSTRARVFEDERTRLEDAQLAKLERVCAALDLGKDDHLLEIGTGWGGLAIHAAATRGCRVTTTTISRNQHAYAIERVRAEGLDDRVEVLLTDYRDLTGTYDKLASIEMIEAVGWQYFPTFFERCAALTKPGGAMFLQAIVIADHLYEQEKNARTFANKHIFPGGCLPSLGLIVDLARRERDAGGAQRRHQRRLRDGPSRSGASASTTPGRSSGRSATTSASPGCGTSTSPPRRRGSASSGSATCRCVLAKDGWEPGEGGWRSPTTELEAASLSS